MGTGAGSAAPEGAGLAAGGGPDGVGAAGLEIAGGGKSPGKGAFKSSAAAKGAKRKSPLTSAHKDMYRNAISKRRIAQEGGVMMAVKHVSGVNARRRRGFSR
jgi:hypothetical protein